MSNVINLFARKPAEAPKADKPNLDHLSEQDANIVEGFKEIAYEKTKESEEGVEALKAIAERNRKNEERIKKEKANANKHVLRAYRIKH